MFAAATPTHEGADARALVEFLNQVVEWRKQAMLSVQWADEPGDVIYTAESEPSANQITLLSFQYARAQAGLLPEQNAVTDVPAGSDNISKLQQQAQDQITQIQAEIDALDKAPVKTTAQRNQREAHRQELESELQLAQARLETLKSFTGFVRQTANRKMSGAGSLAEQIDQLSRSVGLAPPPVSGANRKGGAEGASATPQVTATEAVAAQNTKMKTQSTGIVGLIEESVMQTHKITNIDQLIRVTQDLQSSLNRLRAPLMAELSKTVRQADEIELAADTADAPALAQQKKQLDQSTAQFKLLSSAALPINEESVSLESYMERLQQWKAFVEQSKNSLLRKLGIQVAIVLAAIVALLGFSEIWKRATFRYVRDVRRRSQFLLLRRILMAIIITFVIAFALVTEAGSLATYAGFLTAGLAVALQNVILSVIAYFFLIGRYGVHVGDRVTISGITGDVFEIGLVRLHLVEVSGAGNDMHPTGRSVVFSNSVILQPATSLYKQLPGSDFVWHEVRLTMSPSSDYQRIEKQLLHAVQGVFETYKKGLRFDNPRIGGHFGMNDPQPASRLRFTDVGLEIVIRYPVEVSRVGEIDDRITRVLLQAIADEPNIRLVPPTAPSLQATEHTVPAPPPQP